MNIATTDKSIYIVDGARTPFLKAQGKAGPFSAADLAVQAGQALLLRQSFAITAIDQVIMGCMMPSVDEANIARIIALRLGCDKKTPAYTVQRNCASGLQAIDNACQAIQTGQADIVLAGGTEAMSHAPILYSQAMSNWLGGWLKARTPVARLQQLLRLRLSHLKPIVALLRGLTDPLVGLSMGQTAENIAHQFDISREAMDRLAQQSHQRAQQAHDAQLFTHQDKWPSEIIKLFDHQGVCYEQDNGVREDSSLEKLSTLKPYFDKPFGLITAANSSQVTDGAALLILASEQAVNDHQLPVLARIQACEWAGVDPAAMGLGPVHAMSQLLTKTQYKMTDIDYWELNEAFAGQVLACCAAARDPDYCQQMLGRSAIMGDIPFDRLNIDGGAIALGHPVGASGARIVLHLARTLKLKQAKRGIASLCIGGGQGGAMLIEGEL